MNAASVLFIVAQHHVVVEIKEGNLIAKGKAEAVGNIKSLLKAHKEALLHYLASEHLVESYNERTAIYEFEAGHTREEAERLAYRDIALEYINQTQPESLLLFTHLISGKNLN